MWRWGMKQGIELLNNSCKVLFLKEKTPPKQTAYTSAITKHLSAKLWVNKAWSLCSGWYLTFHSTVSPLWLDLQLCFTLRRQPDGFRTMGLKAGNDFFFFFFFDKSCWNAQTDTGCLLKKPIFMSNTFLKIQVVAFPWCFFYYLWLDGKNI